MLVQNEPLRSTAVDELFVHTESENSNDSTRATIRSELPVEETTDQFEHGF